MTIAGRSSVGTVTRATSVTNPPRAGFGSTPTASGVQGRCSDGAATGGDGSAVTWLSRVAVRVLGTRWQLPRLEASLEASTRAEAPVRIGAGRPGPTLSAKETRTLRDEPRFRLTSALTSALRVAPLATSPSEQTTFAAEPPGRLQPAGTPASESPAGRWRSTTTFGSASAPTFRNVATARTGWPAETAPGTTCTVRVAFGPALTGAAATATAAATAAVARILFCLEPVSHSLPPPPGRTGRYSLAAPKQPLSP